MRLSFRRAPFLVAGKNKNLFGSVFTLLRPHEMRYSAGSREIQALRQARKRQYLDLLNDSDPGSWSSPPSERTPIEFDGNESCTQ